MTTKPQDHTPIKKRSLWVRWLRWVFFSVIGFIFFMALIWAGLQTRWAKDRLTGWMASATADTDSYRVTLEGLDGLLPFSILLDHMTISDAKGAWFEGRHVDISLKWAPLLAGMLDVEWFRMEDLSISRVPESAKASPEKGPVDQAPPSLSLPPIMVREMLIPRIHLAKEVAGAPLDYRLQSKAQTNGPRIEITALVRDLDHPNDALRLTAAYDLNTRQLMTDLTYHESTGGLLTGLMGLSDATGIGVRLKADGPLSGMKGRLDLEMGGYGGAVSAQGTVDLVKGLMDMEAMVSAGDISSFLRGSGLEYEALGPVHLTAKGPFSQPDVTLTTTLGRMGVRNVTLKEITLEARAAFETDYRGLKKTGASITAQEVEVPQVPPLKGPIQLDVAAASPDFRRWDVERLHLKGPDLAVSARGARIDTVNGDISAEILAQLNRFADLVPLDAGDVDGRVDLRALTEGNTLTHHINVDLSMALTRLSGLPPIAAATIGPELTLNTHAAMKDGIVRLEKLHVTGGDAGLDADGRLNMAKGTFDVQYQLFLRDLSGMAGAMKTPLSGDAESRGRMSGRFGDFAADMELLCERLTVNGLNLNGLHTRLETTGLPGKPSGSVLMKGAALNQPFQLSADVAWSDETLTLSSAKADLPGIDLNADLNLTPGKRRFSGTAGGTIRSLELLSALSNLEVEGSGNFRIKAGGPAHDAPVTLDADFKNLRYNDYAISRVGITAQVDDTTTLRGRVSIEAEDAAVRDARIETIKVDVKGALDNAVATIEAKGSVVGAGIQGGLSAPPVSLSARLHMTHEDMWRFRLEVLEAFYRELDVTLAHPATVAIEGRKIALDDLQLLTAKGNLQAKGDLSRDTVEASVRITDLPLSLLDPFLERDLSGTVSVECHISGPLSDPKVHAEGHMRDYRIPRGEGRSPLLLEARLNADRRGDRFEAGLTLSGLDPVPFTATASLPARLSFKPFIFDVDRSEDLKGRLQGHLDLTVLHGLPAVGDQTFSGGVAVDMGVGGSMDNWALNGGITIQNGRYENPASGTILNNITGRLSADGRTLRLTRLTAADGEAGTVALEGGIGTEAPFPLDADLTFNQATLLRKEAATSTASGKLDITGNPKRLDLTGEIILDRTELAIPDQLPPDVVVIPVTEINLPDGMASTDAGPPQDSRLLFMDLSIEIPARFFVRGRGLDAEFKGQLTAQGPANNPVIRGTLNVVRGTFQFLTRTFHITQGQIAFDGARPPVPFLNVTTQVTAGQIDAIVQVSGPADDFKLTLTSQPPLPQDEIMANILFGQSVAKLNAFQAYQLAASISQLSGGGMPDVVGKTRTLLGVDRLSFSSGDNTGRSDDRGPTVSAGKYVSEDVYVGVEQELTDAKQDVVVEVDITPNFSVESRAGTRSGAGIGFNWRYDY